MLWNVMINAGHPDLTGTNRGDDNAVPVTRIHPSSFLVVVINKVHFAIVVSTEFPSLR